jgi:diguanylate cyclase (GGDEF)-like protein
MTMRATLRGSLISATARLRRPEVMALLPIAPVLAFWLGGESALIAAAFGLPAAVALMLALAPARAARIERDGTTGLVLRDTLVVELGAALRERAKTGLEPACVVIAIDDADMLARRQGHGAFNSILRETATRIAGAVRHADLVARLDGACFAVGLAPAQRADLETVLQIASRIQSAVEDNVVLDEAEVQISVSVGFCTADRCAGDDGATLLSAAEAAMEDASHNGPGAIRAFTSELSERRADQSALRTDLAPALNNGEMRPYFQPQISTDTGDITGFEVLVRWQHPDRGLLTPDAFLPLLQAAGLTERLGERMLYHALGSLRTWEHAGHRIASISVNFSAEELRNPRLPDRIAWELDRFGLTPDRLGVEVLETVVAGAADDVIVQNVARLAALGCRIELDDFGTGHASIANIRRFAVSRIKIDRSFVSGLATDREQQRIVAAILSMAERLGLETIAEGVESGEEHALLAQLGCAHVQGYGIARPMPEDETLAWIERYKARAAAPLQLRGHGGS